MTIQERAKKMGRRIAQRFSKEGWMLTSEWNYFVSVVDELGSPVLPCPVLSGPSLSGDGIGEAWWEVYIAQLYSCYNTK